MKGINSLKTSISNADKLLFTSEIFDKNKYHEITFTKEENYYYGDIEYISQGEKTCLLNTPNEISNNPNEVSKTPKCCVNNPK